VAECVARRITDDQTLCRVWELAATTAPPMGFDPAPIYAGGPLGGDFAVLRLEPWQLQVRTLDDLLAGRRPHRWPAQAVAG
jgi:hypothetical protein